MMRKKKSIEAYQLTCCGNTEMRDCWHDDHWIRRDKVSIYCVKCMDHAVAYRIGSKLWQGWSVTVKAMNHGMED